MLGYYVLVWLFGAKTHQECSKIEVFLERSKTGKMQGQERLTETACVRLEKWTFLCSHGDL